MEYWKISSILEERPIGKEVALRGWVYRRRKQKTRIFLLLRDSTGIIQLVVEENSEIFKIALKIGIESSLIAKGIVKEDPRAPGGIEIHLTSLKPISITETFPITKDASREFLLDVRHLWIRSRKMNAILKVRDEVFKRIHEYFRSKGYFEVQAPMFITAAVEGGATLFTVDYFGKKNVYLTQSSQFYLEALIFSLEKVYTIAPSFRAEKSRTRRHLTEFWHAEAEEAWKNLTDITKVEEELITYVVEKVLEEKRKELELLKRDT
ncbi:MAG TPA: asparagine--tRNA ligase, partial [Thermoproteales archaeon]|nr:asparagine--tRNA ligase [Thermoproteales archaeon]